MVGARVSSRGSSTAEYALVVTGLAATLSLGVGIAVGDDVVRKLSCLSGHLDAVVGSCEQPAGAPASDVGPRPQPSPDLLPQLPTGPG